MLGEYALAFIGVKLEEGIGQHELQHGVTQKFKPLIAFLGVGMVLQPGRVCDGGFEQAGVAEFVANPFLQLGKRGTHELALE